MAGLRQSHLFDVLTGEEVAHFAESACMRPFAPGEVAVQQGDQGSSLFFVLRGEMAVVVDETEVARLGQGRMFGEMSLLTGEPRKATVRAVSEALLAELPKSAVADLLDSNERLLESLSQSLARHAATNLQKQSETSSAVVDERSPVDYLKRLKIFFGKG